MNVWIVLPRAAIIGLLIIASAARGQSSASPEGKQSDVSWESLGRPTGENWSSFLGPRGDSTSAETGLDLDRWNPHPPILWSLDLGVGYASPTVVDGKLLLFDRHANVERLSCHNALTGKLLWSWDSPVMYEDQYGYNNGPRCCPIVDEGRIYTYGVSGQLSCIDLKSGELQWTKNLNQEYGVVQNFFGVASTPYVFGDTLMVMVGGSPKDGPSATEVGYRLDLVEPNGTAIVAFDKKTGKERYRVGDDLASYSSVTVRSIGDQPIGLAFARGGLLAWKPETGKRLFQFPWRADMLESVNAALPVVSGNRILVSEAYEVGSALVEWKDNDLRVIRKDKGSRNRLSFRAHWSTPVLVDGYLYGCNGRNQPDSDFRCVSFETGEVQWQKRKHERSSVLVVDGYLIVLGEYGNLEVIRPSPEKLDVVAEVDLSQISKARLSYPCWAAPVLSHGLLYVRGKGRLICFELIPEQVKALGN